MQAILYRFSWVMIALYYSIVSVDPCFHVKPPFRPPRPQKVVDIYYDLVTLYRTFEAIIVLPPLDRQTLHSTNRPRPPA